MVSKACSAKAPPKQYIQTNNINHNMKKFLIGFVCLAISAGSMYAADPLDLLKKLGGSSSSNNTESSGSTGNILSGLGSFVQNVTASDKFSVDELVGTWNYSSAAVSFKSESALKNVGGAAAATALEGQLEPYYQKVGLNKTVLTVDAEHNFTLKLGLITLKGTVEKDSNNQLQFNFSAFGKVSLGKVAAHATKSGSALNITFDATKLVSILTKVSSKANIATLTTLSKLLSSYDNVYMGFKMKKQ